MVVPFLPPAVLGLLLSLASLASLATASRTPTRSPSATRKPTIKPSASLPLRPIKSTRSPTKTPSVISKKSSSPTTKSLTINPSVASTSLPLRPTKSTRSPTKTPSVTSNKSSSPTSRSSAKSPSVKPTRTTSSLAPSPAFRPISKPVYPTKSLAPKRSKYPTVIPNIELPTAVAPLNYKIPLHSSKRGVVANRFVGNISEINSAWFYTYGAPNAIPFMKYGVPYVGMIFCKDTPMPRPAPTYLLGYNEPDTRNGLYPCKRTPLSPLEALNYWPALETSGARFLGSPSHIRANAFSWLQTFLAGNGTYVPKVDFIALHRTDGDPYKILQYVDDTYRLFKKPIWITEFSKLDGGHESIFRSCIRSAEYRLKLKDWLRIVIHGLETRPYVQRYAWYSDLDFKYLSCYSLFDKDKKITDLGKAYAGLKELSI